MSSSRKPGDTLPDVKDSRNAEATATVNSTKLVAGTVYSAEVISRQIDGSYRVAVDDPSTDLGGVQLALPILGGLLGLNVRTALPPKTRVKIAYGRTTFIYAIIPTENLDFRNAKTRSLLWGAKMDEELGVTESNFNDTAEDLIEGEVEINNLFGVAVEFLTTMIRMRAGDLAAVECHLINDMVRVISGQFRHISGLGEDLIFDHGRPTLERTWSMYRHEVMGVLDEKTPFADLNGDEVDREELDKDRITGLGRYRFREFVGFAGDFIHSFVSDPPETIAKLVSGEAGTAAGKSWFHRNSDGSVLLQSVADIRIERVTRIPVPVRDRNHEDPSVTKDRLYDKLTEEFVKLPKGVNPTDPKDAYLMAYHIRSYARWLGRYHSFARMLQLDGEYTVPAEDAAPAPDMNNAEPDREDANGEVAYIDTYACMAISRDGSITLHDGYGSTVQMSNGNLQLSASRHIDLDAAGDIRIAAGGSLLMKARRNIELSAENGGIVMHSYAWIKALCEKGSVWLRSNALTGKDDAAPTPKNTGMPTPEVAWREAGTRDGFGVLLEAAEGSACVRSQKGLALVVDGSPVDESDESYDIKVSTDGDLELYGRRDINIHGNGNLNIGVSKKIVIACQKILGKLVEVSLGNNLTNPGLVYKARRLWAGSMETKQFKSNNIQGAEIEAKEHTNHIGILRVPIEDAESVSAEDLTAAAAADALKTNEPTLLWDSPTEGPQWGFPAREEYIWDGREKVRSLVPESLTQQYLREDVVGCPWNDEGYTAWALRSPVTGKRILPGGGFGYYEQYYQADADGDPLRAPLAVNNSDTLKNPQMSWRPRSAFNMKVLKRPEED